MTQFFDKSREKERAFLAVKCDRCGTISYSGDPYELRDIGYWSCYIGDNDIFIRKRKELVEREQWARGRVWDELTCKYEKIELARSREELEQIRSNRAKNGEVNGHRRICYDCLSSMDSKHASATFDWCPECDIELKEKNRDGKTCARCSKPVTKPPPQLAVHTLISALEWAVRDIRAVYVEDIVPEENGGKLEVSMRHAEDINRAMTAIRRTLDDLYMVIKFTE